MPRIRRRTKRPGSTPYYPSQRRGDDDTNVSGVPRGF